MARKGWTGKGVWMVWLRGVAILVLALVEAGCSMPAPPPVEPGNAVVYVVRREWHTDVGLPVEEIAGLLADLEQRYPGVRFLTFGFGDRQYLINRRTDFGSMLRAMLPSQSTLLMTALKGTPEQAFGAGDVVALHVSRAGLERIEAAIWHELRPSATGEAVWLADGPYPGSAYYASRDTYFGLYTCNTWTAEILRAGGLAMPVTGVLFAGQVMGSAERIATQQAAAARQPP